MKHTTNANNENKLVVFRVLRFLDFLAGLVFSVAALCAILHYAFVVPSAHNFYCDERECYGSLLKTLDKK